MSGYEARVSHLTGDREGISQETLSSHESRFSGRYNLP